MADTRRKNVQWIIPEQPVNWDPIVVAVLMDIRDELQALNQTLRCHRVARGMDALHSIDRRLAKHLPHRKAKRRAKR